MFKNRTGQTTTNDGQSVPSIKCDVDPGTIQDKIAKEQTYEGSTVASTDESKIDNTVTEGGEICSAIQKEETGKVVEDCYKGDDLAPDSNQIFSVPVTCASKRKSYVVNSMCSTTHSTGLSEKQSIASVPVEGFIDPSSKRNAPMTPSTGPNRKITHFKTPTATRLDKSPTLPGIMAIQTRSPFSGGRVLPIGGRMRLLENKDQIPKNLITPLSYTKSLNTRLVNNKIEGLDEKQILMQHLNHIGNDEKSRGTTGSTTLEPSVRSDFEKRKDQIEEGLGIVEMEQCKFAAAVTPGQSIGDTPKSKPRSTSANCIGNGHDLLTTEIYNDPPLLQNEPRRDSKPTEQSRSLLSTGKGLHISGVNIPNRRNQATAFKIPPPIGTPFSVTQKVSLQTSSIHKSIPQQRLTQQPRKSIVPNDMLTDQPIVGDAVASSNIFDDDYQVFLDKLRDYSDKEQLFNNMLLDMTVSLSIEQTNLLEVEAEMMDLTTELEQLLQSTCESMQILSKDFQ
jgi:hypothetical protein